MLRGHLCRNPTMTPADRPHCPCPRNHAPRSPAQRSASPRTGTRAYTQAPSHRPPPQGPQPNGLPRTNQNEGTAKRRYLTHPPNTSRQPYNAHHGAAIQPETQQGTAKQKGIRGECLLPLPTQPFPPANPPPSKQRIG